MHTQGGGLLLLGATAILLGSVFSMGSFEQTRSALTPVLAMVNCRRPYSKV